MKILALDSSLGGCSVALWTDDDGVGEAGRVLGSAREDGATGQAEQLAPMIARMIAALPGGFAAVDRLAVTVGPGYFTGLRAGLAAARGLALAAKRPLVGITTLAAVAAGVPLEERAGATIVVALDSKRSEAFFQLFSNDLMPAGEPETMAPGAYARKLRDLGGERLVVAGNGTALLGRALDGLGVAWCRSAAAERPDAALLARLARAAPAPTAAPGPLYLHAPATTSPRNFAAAAEAARTRGTVTP